MSLFLSVTDISAATANQSTVTMQSTQQKMTATTSYTVNAASSNTKTTFTTSQIISASTKVKGYVERYHKLPAYVDIAGKKVTIPQYLQLLTDGLIQTNNKVNNPIELKKVNKPSIIVKSAEVENVKSGKLNRSEYIKIAKTIKTTIAFTGKAPRYVNSSLGKIGYESLIYTYSKTLNFFATSKRLPNTVSIKPWKIIISQTEGAASISGDRPVYIVSDYINSLKQDNSRITAIICGLEKLGISAYKFGNGPNTHLTVLTSKNVPYNALIVEIAGGADAGAILEKSSEWYKSILNKRKDFIVFTSGAKKITGLDWLERAHDDSYSPASFKGISHPDQFLINNGFNFFEDLNGNNISQLCKLIYKEACS